MRMEVRRVVVSLHLFVAMTMVGLTPPPEARVAAHLMRSVPGVLPKDGGVAKSTEMTGFGIGYGSRRTLVRHGPMMSKPQQHSLATEIVSVTSYTRDGYYYGRGQRWRGRRALGWDTFFFFSCFLYYTCYDASAPSLRLYVCCCSPTRVYIR